MQRAERKRIRRAWLAASAGPITHAQMAARIAADAMVFLQRDPSRTGAVKHELYEAVFANWQRNTVH